MSKKPTTVEEAMQAFNDVLSLEDQAQILKTDKEELIMYHHGLGRWIRNNWGLWDQNVEQGTLLQHMIDLGFQHPDDMSQALIVEYWARMNHQPSQFQDDINRSKEYWKEKNGS